MQNEIPAAIVINNSTSSYNTIGNFLSSLDSLSPEGIQMLATYGLYTISAVVAAGLLYSCGTFILSTSIFKALAFLGLWILIT